MSNSKPQAGNKTSNKKTRGERFRRYHRAHRYGIVSLMVGLAAAAAGFICRLITHHTLLHWAIWAPPLVLVTVFGLVSYLRNEGNYWLILIGLCAASFAIFPAAPFILALVYGLFHVL